MLKINILCSLALLCRAQTMTENSMNPSDIANLPEPTELGPPVGTESATASYDSAAALSSVSSLVSSMADSPASLDSGLSIPTITGHPKYPALYAISTGSLRPTGVAGRRIKRDRTYPIDTRNFPVPKGWTPAFASLDKSTQGKGYLTYKTLSTYDPTQCAAACSKISACQFFNIYWEKDPDANNNPVDVIKCALYSIPQSKATATNAGQWRGSFRIIITGSNGYNKASLPAAPKDYSLVNLDNRAVDAPTNDKLNQLTFIQSLFLDTYDPTLCSAACDQITAQNKANTRGCNYQTCTYANLYILSEDGVPKTTVCTLYTQNWDQKAIKESYDANNYHYQVSNSIGLTQTERAQVYPKECYDIDPCVGFTGTCIIGNLMLENWLGDGVNRYNGFYGNYSEGSLLQHTRDGIDPEGVVAFRAAPGYPNGYIVHKKTGKCFTFLPNPAKTRSFQFEHSNIILTSCATTDSPPDSQSFILTDYYWWTTNFYCTLGYSDTYYTQNDMDPNGGKRPAVFGEPFWCMHLAPL